MLRMASVADVPIYSGRVHEGLPELIVEPPSPSERSLGMIEIWTQKNCMLRDRPFTKAVAIRHDFKCLGASTLDDVTIDGLSGSSPGRD